MPPDTKTAPRGRLSADAAAVLLIDHQAGLLSLVQEYGPDEFRNNVLALADTAKEQAGNNFPVLIFLVGWVVTGREPPPTSKFAGSRPGLEL